MTTEGNLSAALRYAELGIPVMPLKPRGKVPVLKDWTHEATTDPERIRGWWEPRPGCNIGGVMGEVVCLDFDVDDEKGYDSRDWLAEWEGEHGKLPETATAVTGRGGSHLYYRVDRPVPKSENGELHIDIRGIGSQAVLPPSIHPNGNRYFWDLDPDDVGIADADEKVYALIEAVRPRSGGRGKSVKLPKKPVLEGEGRNKELYRQGCSVRGKGSDDALVAAWLETLNQRICKPPLGTGELQKIVESVCKLPIGNSDEVKAAKAEGRRGRPRKFQHNSVARSLIEERGACMIDGVTPAIRDESGRYLLGWDAFDAAVIDMHDDCTEGNRREVKAYIKAKAPTRRQSPWNLIAFRNGVLDVNTLELRGWDEGDVITNVIPHDWNPQAYDDTLFRTLDRMACGDTATMMNLGEFIGICMMRDVTRMPYYPVLIGVGSNGKSTYIKLLKNVLGADNICALQPKELGARFMGEHIVGKLANLGDDIANSYLDGNECGAIKRISTGENVFTDIKGTKGYYFEPYCTMVFSCNQFPRCADTTEGFMRRLFPIEFNARFSPSDEGYDPLVGEKLASEGALEYACVLGIENLRRALAQNAPTSNRISESVKRGIAAEGNTGLQWFNDEGIDRAWLLGKTKEEAWREYELWCERNGYSRTAMASGTLSALIGTYFGLSCTKTAHRGSGFDRRTVKVYEDKGAKGATQKAQVK